MTHPIAVLYAGMGHRLPDALDTELRARLGMAVAAGSGTATASALPLQTALTARAVTSPDPVGSLRVYRLPLLSSAVSGVPFGLAATPCDAPRPAHPYGYFEKGSHSGHSGPVTALVQLPGETHHLMSSAADGTVLTWALSPAAMWANWERSGARIIGLSSGASSGGESERGAGAKALAVPAAAAGAPASLASESVHGFSRVSPGAPLGGASAGSNWLPWAETSALAAEELERLAAERLELVTRLSELNTMNKHAERLREAELREEMGAVEERYHSELVLAREALEAARVNKAEVEARGEDARLALASQESAEETAMKALYAGKLAAEEARLERRALEKAAYAHREEEEAHRLVGERKRELEALQVEHAMALEALREECEECESEASVLRAAGGARTGILEAGLDAELEATRAKLELRCAEEARNAAALKGENASLKRVFGGIVSATDAMQEALAQCRGAENKLDGVLRSLEKDYAALVKDLRERDSMLEDKDARIVDIKVKTQELEKFKFVLNYKIQELKRAVMPRKRDITNLRATLSEMEIELLQLHKSSSLLAIMVEELKLKRRGLLRSQKVAAAADAADSERLANIHRDMASLGELRRATAALLAAADASKNRPTHSPGGRSVLSEGPAVDVSAASAASASAARLRGVLVALYQKYILGEVSSARGAEQLPSLDPATGALVFPVGVAPDEVAEEVAASRNFLEAAVAGLREKIEQDGKLQARGAVRLTSENTALLAEVNDLRRGLRYSWGELLKARASASVTPGAAAGRVQAAMVMEALGEPVGEAEVQGGGDASAGASRSTQAPAPSQQQPLAAAAFTAGSVAAATSFARRTSALLGVVGVKGAAGSGGVGGGSVKALSSRTMAIPNSPLAAPSRPSA